MPAFTNLFPRPTRKGCACCCAGCLSVPLLLVALVFYALQRVPRSYPAVNHPIPPPQLSYHLGGGLVGYASPYIGHTGSWDGSGGTMQGKSKVPELDTEKAMGLRWTFMPVYWRRMEADGPVDLNKGTPPAWQELDSFVRAAHDRGMNILMQAPVVGGNAGGPPNWAGRREKDKSAPSDMDALARFAGKLAARYRPGGVLARQNGWGDSYGVRAWELDNEPGTYLTSWNGQAADYAEFVTKAAHSIHQEDPHAVIVAPAIASGGEKSRWLEETLDASRMAGSPIFRKTNTPFSIGPVVDVVSFHVYEGLDTVFSGKDRTIELTFNDVREVFEANEKRVPNFNFARKEEYWQTEGNFDFIGVLSAERRAAWRFQFFSRAFAAGVRKVVVMDASAPEQVAVQTYVQTLPDPFPMNYATEKIRILKGKAVAFRHIDRMGSARGEVWVVWAMADTGDATIEVPVRHEHVETISVAGKRVWQTSTNHHLRLTLPGDQKMPVPLLVVDRVATD